MVEIQPDLCLERLSIERLKTPSSDQGFEWDPARTDHELAVGGGNEPVYAALAVATFSAASTPCSDRTFFTSGREGARRRRPGKHGNPDRPTPVRLDSDTVWDSGEAQGSCEAQSLPYLAAAATFVRNRSTSFTKPS
jgi:hypothetical protein